MRQNLHWAKKFVDKIFANNGENGKNFLLVEISSYRMAGNFVGANFRKKSDKAPRINFRGFKFRGCNPCSLQVQCGTNDKWMM